MSPSLGTGLSPWSAPTVRSRSPQRLSQSQVQCPGLLVDWLGSWAPRSASAASPAFLAVLMSVTMWPTPAPPATTPWACTMGGSRGEQKRRWDKKLSLIWYCSYWLIIYHTEIYIVLKEVFCKYILLRPWAILGAKQLAKFHWSIFLLFNSMKIMS